MNNRSKMLMAIGAGLLAGGAFGYYLNSEKGKRMRKKAKKAVRDQADQLSERFSQLATDAKSWFDNMTTTAKSKIEEMAETAEDNVDGVKKNLKKGAEKAKARMKSTADKIENAVGNNSTH